MSTGAQFIAMLVLIVVGGGLAYWSWLDWRERKRARERHEMEKWAEPSRFARTHEYQADDEVTERPFLPEEYPPLPDDHRRWK